MTHPATLTTAGLAFNAALLAVLIAAINHLRRVVVAGHVEARRGHMHAVDGGAR